ncbi:hypothetical protein [Bacillus sp. REN3]|uniref:hypothetical protein n=1 Tax=Bacillus sp. REN3 TaxID=2802440 RepID=UPI001AEE3EEB|nr:hypothetical protein [Bacillus sp. REN3]
MDAFLKVMIGILLLAGMIFIFQGYDKLTNYSNPNPDEELFADDEDMVNAYVGGDAYNYIINAERATGMFVLAGFSFVLAVGSGILLQMRLNTSKNLNVKGSDFSIEG